LDRQQAQAEENIARQWFCKQLEEEALQRRCFYDRVGACAAWDREARIKSQKASGALNLGGLEKDSAALLRCPLGAPTADCVGGRRA
jgi:hypothetical protein